MDQRNFPEADWKHWRRISPVALDRFCSGALEQAVEIVQGDGTAHARFLRLHDMLRDRDEQLSRVFDDQRRSRAYRQLAAAADLGLLTPEEFAGFSGETKALVAVLLGEE